MRTRLSRGGDCQVSDFMHLLCALGPEWPQVGSRVVSQEMGIGSWGHRAVGFRHTDYTATCLWQRTLKCISRDRAGRPEAPFLKLMCTDKWPLCSGPLPMRTPACRLLCVFPCSCGGLLTGSSVSPWSSSTCQTQVYAGKGSNRAAGLHQEKGQNWMSVARISDLYCTVTAT